MRESEDFAETVMMGALPPAPPHRPQTLDIRFTGSGSEYFRIWIVNLLLTLVTLTLYLPFARARRMAYFQNNTLVGGDPLGFHADPWKMFRGYLLVLVLGLGYWAVSNFMPAFSWAALVVFMALWPLLWRSSLQFRLRNTSWRGVRLNFVGDTKSAYMAMLPMFLPALAFVGLLPEPVEGEEIAEETARYAAAVAGAVVLAFVLLLPWLWARIKRYQHGGYAFAQERTELTVGAGRFYGLFFKILGVSLAVMLVVGSVMGAAFGVLMLMGMTNWAELSSGGGALAGLLAAVVFGVIVLMAYVLMPLIVGSYTTSRLQNLLWANTRSQKIEFQSDLRLGPLFRVGLVNWLLIALTLGLYWPFAKVRQARVKLEAMSLVVQGDVDEWVAEAQPAGRGVLGDAAGDFFGIDMGL